MESTTSRSCSSVADTECQNQAHCMGMGHSERPCKSRGSTGVPGCGPTRRTASCSARPLEGRAVTAGEHRPWRSSPMLSAPPQLRVLGRRSAVRGLTEAAPHRWLGRAPGAVCVQITAYRAGHVLGAAMFMVEIAGMRCLYTGDYSRVSDRHLPAADLPSPSPNIGEWVMARAWVRWAVRFETDNDDEMIDPHRCHHACMSRSCCAL